MVTLIMDDYDGQMIFGHLGGQSFLTLVLQMRKNPDENLTQETCPDRGSNLGPLRDSRACYRLPHSGGRNYGDAFNSHNSINIGSFYFYVINKLSRMY